MHPAWWFCLGLFVAVVARPGDESFSEAFQRMSQDAIAVVGFAVMASIPVMAVLGVLLFANVDLSEYLRGDRSWFFLILSVLVGLELYRWYDERRKARRRQEWQRRRDQSEG